MTELVIVLVVVISLICPILVVAMLVLKYDRLNTEYEILDVITVCHSCHKKLHKG